MLACGPFSLHQHLSRKGCLRGGLGLMFRSAWEGAGADECLGGDSDVRCAGPGTG